MKFITKIITVSFVTVVLPFTGMAQDFNSLTNQKGFEISQEGGVVAKLMKLQNFSKQHKDVPIYDPQQRLLSQLGINPKNNLTTYGNDYQFYGGTNYKGNNIPLASVTDALGNTYITGASSNETQPAGDFFTLKVSPSGTILWQVREPAIKYAVETGMILVLDISGNLIVSGISWNGNDMDIQTLKYNTADGTKIWEDTYDAANNGIDAPTAMTVDATGNIYITGISYSGVSLDYITLKYSAAGDLMWDMREGAGNNTWNEPTAITLDVTGNIIVTGYSPNPDGWLNYHTIKYNTNGEEIWTQDYNYVSTAPENPSDVTNSVPYAITTDTDDNIYVTGEFDTFVGHFGTIKYNAAGVMQWVQDYKSDADRTQAFKIATKDNVIYVLGTHRGGFANDGNVLIAYSLTGEVNWMQETTDLIDAFNPELLFDTNNNIIVAARGMTPGAEEGIIDTAARAKKYSPTGELLGRADFVISSPESTATLMTMAGAGLDSDGNIYFAVNSYYTEQGAVFETVKSAFGTTSPNAIWNTTYANLGTSHASMLNSFQDNNGGTISTGRYYNFADGILNPNFFVVKHNATGDISWKKVYNTANGNPANGIIGKSDNDGNIFICLLPDEGQTALTIKKIAPTGAELWATEVELINPQVYVMEASQDGSLYLGGVARQTETATHSSFTAIKLSATGEEIWRSYKDSPNTTDNVYGINAGKINIEGDFILTGVLGTGSMVSQDVDLTIVKFNNDGTPAWITSVPVTDSSSSGTDLLINSEGEIYTNGFASNNTTFRENIVTAKLNADGTLLWAKEYGEANKNERSYTLKQFSNGDIAVSGYSLAMNDIINNTLIKYNAGGNEVWTFASEDMRFYNDFHIDGSDKCYIMTQMIINPFPHKIFNAPFPTATLIVIDDAGNGEEEFFVGPEYAEFYGERLIPHQDDRLLLAGSAANQAFYEGLYFFETQHDGTLGVDTHTPVKEQNYLGQNYPNPAVSTTNIPFYLVQGGKASIKLYNSQGRFIKEIANDSFSVGQNSITFETTGLSEGIYFYQITAGKFKQARKMVITQK